MTDNNVIQANFKKKREDVVLTCTKCSCQVFFVVFDPLKEGKNKVALECAACHSLEKVIEEYPF